ncbi:hypothetical protein J5X84_01230 [Streptosporangiaceae bacterium NEAU-GS5]|nr:hypothetical protein [Streptosporangiaceae bacterium NEAU-GS5]
MRLIRGNLVPVALALVWLAVALTHLSLPYPSDQLHYLGAGATFPYPVENSQLVHQMTRFGLTGPTRLAIAVFGYSQAAYYAVPLVAGLTLLLGTYAVGAQLYSRTVGAAAAAVLLACTPIFVDATQLLPDLFATGLFTTAVALGLAVRQERIPAAPYVFAGIGLLLGWSYSAREFIVFVWPLVPLILWPKIRGRGLIWLVAPILVVIAGESLLCWIVYGDPLARVKAILGHAQGPAPEPIAASFRDKPRTEYMMRLWQVLGGYPETRYSDHLVLHLLLAGTVIGGLVWWRTMGLLLGWVALLYVPLTLFGGVLDPSAPKLRLQLVRYWMPIFPAFVLGGIALVWLLASRLKTGPIKGGPIRTVPIKAGPIKAGPIAATVAAVACLVVSTPAWSQDRLVDGGHEMSALRAWLTTHVHVHEAVWSDTRTRSILDVYQNGPFGGQAWPGRVETYAAGGPKPGHLIVLFDTDSGQVCGVCRLYGREVLATRTPSWHEVYASPEGLVRVYEVPEFTQSP